MFNSYMKLPDGIHYIVVNTNWSSWAIHVSYIPTNTPTKMLHLWNIYLQNRGIYRVNVGKYTQSMEHMGKHLPTFTYICPTFAPHLPYIYLHLPYICVCLYTYRCLLRLGAVGATHWLGTHCICASA